MTLLASVLLAANFALLVINALQLVRLRRESRRLDRDLDDLAARIAGLPRNPFPPQER